MWEYKNKEGKVIKINARHSENKRCKCCGQYFCKGEEFYMIIPPSQYRGKSGIEPFFVHPNEWDSFSKGVKSDLDLAEKIRSHSTPRVKPLSDVQKEMIDIFTQAAMDYGFRNITKNKNLVRGTRYHSSDYVEYNVYLDTMSCGSRKKSMMFDSLFERQVVANIRNRMNVLLGKPERDNFDAIQTINKMVDEAKKNLDDMI